MEICPQQAIVAHFLLDNMHIAILSRILSELTSGTQVAAIWLLHSLHPKLPTFAQYYSYTFGYLCEDSIVQGGCISYMAMCLHPWRWPCSLQRAYLRCLVVLLQRLVSWQVVLLHHKVDSTKYLRVLLELT